MTDDKLVLCPVCKKPMIKEEGSSFWLCSNNGCALVKIHIEEEHRLIKEKIRISEA